MKIVNLTQSCGLFFILFRPSFPGHDLIFLSKFNSQVMWNLLFEPLIGNFKSDVKFLIWIFFLWQLISCQTLKLRPKINVCKKNQISDRKIKSCWIDLIWNLLLDLTWFIFAVFDVKLFWLLIYISQRKRALIEFKYQSDFSLCMSKCARRLLISPPASQKFN